MRVCDRHADRKAADTVHIVMDDSYIDVCTECKTDVLELLHLPPLEDEPPRKRGIWRKADRAA